MQQSEHTQKDTRTKNFSILGVAIIVIVGLAVVLSHKKATAPEEPIETPVVDVTETPTTLAPGLSYADAVAQYKGRSVALTGVCTFDPQVQTQAPGARILINNASSTTQKLTIGADMITLTPLHYKTVKLPATEGKFFIGCGDEANAATITITK